MPLERQTSRPRLPFAEADVRAAERFFARTGICDLQDIFAKL